MPRPRQSSASSLSPGQSAYVLERLISERRVSPGDVNRILSEMGREINALEDQLQRLRGLVGGGSAPAQRGPGRPPGRRRGRPGRPPASASPAPAAVDASSKGGARRGRRRRSAITAEQLASRQLQGRYLALVRQFPATKRAQYARIAKERGREVAIREMQDSLKK